MAPGCWGRSARRQGHGDATPTNRNWPTGPTRRPVATIARSPGPPDVRRRPDAHTVRTPVTPISPGRNVGVAGPTRVAGTPGRPCRPHRPIAWSLGRPAATGPQYARTPSRNCRSRRPGRPCRTGRPIARSPGRIGRLVAPGPPCGAGPGWDGASHPGGVSRSVGPARYTDHGQGRAGQGGAGRGPITRPADRSP